MDTYDFEDTLDIVRPFRNLDSAGGVFRHVSFADSEFLGIHISGDNANTLLLLANTPKQAVAFARKLLKALLNGKSILLTEEILNELEDIWTGGASHFANPALPVTEYVVRLLLKRSLSDDWNQVRELSYLAASQEGLDVLVTRAELKRPIQNTASACAQQDVTALVRGHLSVPAIRGLRAAIAREALSLETTILAPDDTKSEQLVLMKEKKDQVHGLIHEIYRKHKVGMREPTESFIRRSTRIDEQIPERVSPSSSTLQQLDKRDHLDPYSNGSIQYVLIIGRCIKSSSGSGVKGPTICFYGISGPPETPKALDVRTALQQILHTNSPIHITERYAKNSLSTNWNLDTFQEIYRPVPEYERGGIKWWIAHLGRIGDRFDSSQSNSTESSKTSSPSITGVSSSKRKISTGRRQGETQHPRKRNKSQSSPSRLGKYSASNKTQRRPMVIDLTEDDGPEVQEDLYHLCKRLFIRPKESIRTSSPSRSAHSGESNVASNGMILQAPDQTQPEAQAVLPASRQAHKRLDQRIFNPEAQDALARWWGRIIVPRT